jgi:phosphoribosyl-ATP pyrophosphohydrolase
MPEKSQPHPIDSLFATINSRKKSDVASSYTAQLLKAGVSKCAKKFGEESVELALAAVGGDRKEIAAESADVLYHLLVLWAASGIAPKDVYAVLKSREGMSGIAEKASRKR